MCVGVSTASPPLKTLPHHQPPPPRQYPFILFFCEPLPLKIRFFGEPQKCKSFSSSTPPYLLKVTKFVVKISQFEFLVMTEKNFCLQTFFVIKSYFSLCQNCNHPHFPTNFTMKIQVLSSCPPFLKIW